MEKSLNLKRLEFLDNRMELDTHKKRELQNLKRGYQGEKYVYNLLKSYSFKNWDVLSDIHLRSPIGYVQIDFLLLTGKDIYIFEVKNYAFSCIMQNNRWFFDNQKPLGTNISHQVQSAKLHLQRIFENEIYPPTIHPCILFVNPEYSPKILGNSEELILNAHQINLFLSEIPVNHESRLTEQYRKVIGSFLHTNSELFFMEDKELKGAIKLGVYCASCKKFDLHQKDRTVVCQSCGATESKKNCIKRLTEEYCVISLKRTISARNIADFSSNFFTRRQVSVQMTQFLKSDNKGRYATYHNPLFNSTKDL